MSTKIAKRGFSRVTERMGQESISPQKKIKKNLRVLPLAPSATMIVPEAEQVGGWAVR
jgi:hypothetical protein